MTRGKRFDPDDRCITEYLATSKPGIYLSIVTAHQGRALHTRVTRVQMDGVLIREKFTMHNEDPCPVARLMTPVARYSSKQLDAQHESFVAENVAGEAQRAALIAWAERF